MNNTEKWSMTKEPAVYEGLEYYKIVYRDENGQIVDVIDDPPCMIGNEISDILLLLSGINILKVPSLLKNITPKITITGKNKNLGDVIMKFTEKYLPKRKANNLNNNPFENEELFKQSVVCRLDFNPTELLERKEDRVA